MGEEQRRQQRAKERRQKKQRKEKDEWKREKKRGQPEMVTKAKDLYHRVMRLSDLNQMEKILLDSRGNYRKNYLIMFVGNKKAEKAGEEDYHFPFPFAMDGGEFGDADFIQVAKVSLVSFLICNFLRCWIFYVAFSFIHTSMQFLMNLAT